MLNVRLKSIKTKMILYFCILMVVVCGGLGIISYLAASNTLIANVNETLPALAKQGASIVEGRVDAQLSTLEAVAENSSIKSKDVDLEEKLKILDAEAKRSEHIMMAIVDKEGNSMSTNRIKANLSDRDYYKKALSGEKAVADPLVSKEDKSIVLPYAVPIRDKGEVIGVLIALRDGNNLSTITNDITFGKSGKAFMLNSKGTTIAHSNPDLVINMDNSFENVKTDPKLQPLVDIEKLMVEGKNDVGEYQYDGITKYLGFAPVKSTGWSIAIAAPKSEVLGGLDQLRNISIIMAIVFLFLGMITAYLIAKGITDPIKLITQKFNQISTGDLDVDIPKKYLKAADEMGLLANSANNIIGNLKEKADVSEKVANGDLNVNVKVLSEKDTLSKSMQLFVETIRNLVSEVSVLTKEAVDGNLDKRGDAQKFNGAYQEIVCGMNSTLDAVIEPLKESSKVLQEMAKGNLQVKVNGNYKGDHAIIKDALNNTIDTLSSYIKEIAHVLSEMANSNLEVGITAEYRGDFIQIKDVLNTIIASFNEIMTEINNAAGQVASGARQVSESSQALSQGSTEQASSIEELTASMEEIAEQTKLNAINANEANELAVSAKDNAVQGNDQMHNMVKAMGDINESSSNISKIIKVIDEIAFQTNILALNAAVEAARAGQHGKGFAVVAEEVRNLAARSANAAKETTALIEGSIKKVEFGTRIANDTAGALNKIVEDVSTAAKLVGEIAVASNEQATAIAQVNQGILQVSQVTQTNSATSEEGAAASEELSGQAEMLSDMVAKFQLKKTSAVFKNSEAISEDVMQLIENMANKKMSSKLKDDVNRKKTANYAKGKIILSDNEFGKY